MNTANPKEKCAENPEEKDICFRDVIQRISHIVIADDVRKRRPEEKAEIRGEPAKADAKQD